MPHFFQFILRKLKNKTVLILIVSFFLCSCNFNEDDIKEGWWKYGSGYHIGDVLDFKKQHHIANDTIYFNDEPKALLIDYRKSFAGYMTRELRIKSLESDAIGTYHRKK